MPRVLGSDKTILRAVVSLTATGTVVAAENGKHIKVTAFEIQSRSDSMTVQFRDGTAGDFLGLRWAFNTREGALAAPVNAPSFLFATSYGTALVATITGTGTVDIAVSYFAENGGT